MNTDVQSCHVVLATQDELERRDTPCVLFCALILFETYFICDWFFNWSSFSSDQFKRCSCRRGHILSEKKSHKRFRGPSSGVNVREWHPRQQAIVLSLSFADFISLNTLFQNPYQDETRRLGVLSAISTKCGRVVAFLLKTVILWKSWFPMGMSMWLKCNVFPDLQWRTNWFVRLWCLLFSRLCSRSPTFVWTSLFTELAELKSVGHTLRRPLKSAFKIYFGYEHRCQRKVNEWDISFDYE